MRRLAASGTVRVVTVAAVALLVAACSDATAGRGGAGVDAGPADGAAFPTTDGQATDGQATDGQATDGQATDGQAADGLSEDGAGAAEADGTADAIPDSAADVTPPVDECATHADCAPDRVCARWASTGARRCSQPCAGGVDCPTKQVCTKLPGGAQVGFCQAPLPGGGYHGTSCEVDTDCATLSCVQGKCADVCQSQNACLGDTVCGLVGDPKAGDVRAACADAASGKLALGDVCEDAQHYYVSDVCASGHCDLLFFQVTGGFPTKCAPLCMNQADCLDTQTCGIVAYAHAPSPDVTVFSPAVASDGTEAMKAPLSAVAGCYTRVTGLAADTPDGEPCDKGAQCQGGQCMTLLSELDGLSGNVSDGARYCTRLCTKDADCPDPAMRCALELTTMTNPFLANDGGDDFPFSYADWTYVRVCKLP